MVCKLENMRMFTIQQMNTNGKYVQIKGWQPEGSGPKVEGEILQKLLK